MIDLKRFEKTLIDEGIEFITGVPDTLLNELCLHVEKNWPSDRHVIAANEGNAIGLAAGYHLTSEGMSLVYMQNSGMGNTINPLLSLTNKEVYSIPLLMVIGWRGNPKVNDHPQHEKQGVLTPKLLEIMDIPYRILDSSDEEQVLEDTKWAIRKANEIGSPVALIAQKGVFERGEKEDLSKRDSDLEMSRELAIKTVIKTLPLDTLYVATTGRATRELHEIRNLNNQSHEFDFLNIGAMGHASSIAVGMAIAAKDRVVVCLDGDAGALMHLGSIAINGSQTLNNFIHIVLNNGVHESVGGQNSVGHKINLTEFANHSGYATSGAVVKTESELVNTLNQLKDSNKPAFIDVHIRKGMRSDMPALKIDPLELKRLLMNAALQKNDE